jgi:putative transposase
MAMAEGQAIEGYRSFVVAAQGQPSPWEDLKRQLFLGSDAFVESM